MQILQAKVFPQRMVVSLYWPITNGQSYLPKPERIQSHCVLSASVWLHKGLRDAFDVAGKLFSFPFLCSERDVAVIEFSEFKKWNLSLIYFCVVCVELHKNCHECGNFTSNEMTKI